LTKRLDKGEDVFDLCLSHVCSRRFVLTSTICSPTDPIACYPFLLVKLWNPITERPVITSLNVNIKVVIGDGEPVESALRRFKREINKSGHLMDLRHKRYFESTQEKKNVRLRRDDCAESLNECNVVEWQVGCKKRERRIVFFGPQINHQKK
jgi:small subunit ribosomal protein S21